MLSTLLALATAASLAFSAFERTSLARANAAQGALQDAPVQSAQPKIAQSRRDFTTDLPAHTDPAAVLAVLQCSLCCSARCPAALAVLQRSCAATGVTLQGVRIDERQPSVRELGRTQLTLQLRGTYPNIKNVLIDVQDHFAALTVRNLSLHRNSSSSLEGEGNATLAIWSRPLSPSPAAPLRRIFEFPGVSEQCVAACCGHSRRVPY